MEPADVADLRPLGTLAIIELLRPDGEYLGMELHFSEALYPILGRVLRFARPPQVAARLGDVVVFRPLTYTEAWLDDERRVAFIEEAAMHAVLDGYDTGGLTIRPLGDRVVIRADDEPEKSRGGVFMPDRAHRKPATGEVLAVADPASEIRVGDVVHYRKQAATELRIEAVSYEIVRQRDVLAVAPRAASVVG